MPLVSVIVPNYNHEKYLDKRILSILHQTCQDIEVLILDDCSTDNSRDVLEKYRSHEKVAAIVHNEVNSGSTFIQWQKGFALAKGKYIWIAESDDFSEPTFLQELVSQMEADNKIALAFCQTIYVSTTNQITAKTETAYLQLQLPGSQFVASRMLGTNAIVNASMVVFRKDHVKNMSDDYSKMKYCGDWLFWINLCLEGDVLISGKYLNYYLRHNNNVASVATRRGYDFTEGNVVFHYVKNKLDVKGTDLINGLNERVTEYLRTKDNFENEEIGKTAYKLMLELDPRITKMIRKRLSKQKMVGFLKTVQKLIS